MRLLHTSDWHVGKAIRGRSRAAEHQAVLAEIAAVAERQSVDLAVVAGDLFDTATPTPEAERIVYRALLDLAVGGRPVVVVAGNHDSAQRLAAVAPLSQASGIHVASAIRPPGDGGVLEVEVGGEVAQVALLPFPSQRYVVTADVLLSGDAAAAHAEYADRVVRIVRTLTGGFRAGTVNLVVAHLMVMGGTMGGGERGAHTVFDYWVPATAFPASAQYVALGHLHRAQQLAGPAPLHYCGSPLQLDFGETANDPQVHVVDVLPGRPAEVRPVPLAAGRRLRTVRGTLVDVLAAVAGPEPEGSAAGDDPAARGDGGVGGRDHLRIVLDEPARAGLADDVRERVPDAVEVVLAPRDDERRGERVADPDRLRRTPHDLFAEYLARRDVRDERLLALFDGLVDEVESEPVEAAP
ncbi:MAG TPA: exonuclease SbcCD subunit D [Acidimicrobiales bacterium]|jgi:exonuclease SbcD|nr:exonuclease SbcCD subunit D [Acidimicrobiales bacterium]